MLSLQIRLVPKLSPTFPNPEHIMHRLSTLGEGFLLVFFSALISCLTVYGALGVDPSTINQPSALREATAAHRQ